MAGSLYILDGHAQIYRAFYAPFRDLTSPTGEPTRATHVFCQMLFNLLRQRRPDYLAMALDVGDETVFRRTLDANYKAHREPPPEALEVQVNRIVSIVSAMGVPVLRVPGFEADDVMATIAHRLSHHEVEVYLVSRDKDLDQLITDRVRLYDVNNDEVTDRDRLLAVKGYAPAQAVEIQTLAGDATDNIPGVQGVGLKTAAKLIAQYGTAEAAVAHAGEQTPKLAERLRAFAPQLPVTRRLVTLRRDVPVEFDLERCRTSGLSLAAVRPLFDELGFTRMHELLDATIADLGGGRPPASTAPAPALANGLHGPQLQDERGSYHLIDTPEKLAAFAAQLARQPAFAFDTETTALNPVQADLVGMSFAWRRGEAYYLPVLGTGGALLPRDLVVGTLRPILENPAVAKVGQNMKYDIVVLRQCGIEVAGLAFDTLLASFLLDPLRSSHSLDSLAKTHLNHEMIPITDLIGKGQHQTTMDNVETSRACEYAAEDADYTWRLKELLEPRMAGSPVERLFRETEMPLVQVLAEMEHNGIALDPALLRTLGASIATRVDELTHEIHRAAGHAFNVDSPKQLAAVLFDELQLGVVRQTKTGRSTDADTLETLAAQTDHLIPRLVLEYRELAKLKNTYVDTLPRMICRRTGRIHASFHQTGAVTGRLSSSDPNLQNIPIRTDLGRRIREAFVAGDADQVLLTADYSQVELRLLAHFCKDQALCEAFRGGQDIHRAVAAQVNGVSADEVTPQQRSAAKAVNFGIIYGQSAFGLARSLGIPVSEARQFIDTYFRRYPGIRAFIDRCVTDARRTGYAETILGRRRPIEELRSRNRGQVSFGERIAVNTVVQGSAADLIKRAMIDIHREIKTGRLPARMLIQVHDELVLEVPRTAVEDTAKVVREKMEKAMTLEVPIIADVHWGRTWAEGK
ncbi:MAG: DNA polymerase I [Planctomycetes bacterium]|nr:DNA polymerase I [Planctomycetota bacterium]